jgi:hypothetical protein
MRVVVPIDKAIAIALHKLGYGGTLYMAEHHLENLPLVSSKFTNNICEVLVTHFYDRCIQISMGDALQKIMACFESLIKISYMRGAIERIHICLIKKPSKKKLLVGYFNHLKFHYILL